MTDADRLEIEIRLADIDAIISNKLYEDYGRLTDLLEEEQQLKLMLKE